MGLRGGPVEKLVCGLLGVFFPLCRILKSMRVNEIGEMGSGACDGQMAEALGSTSGWAAGGVPGSG